MAITADRVIVELEAKLDRYNANVLRAEQQFTRSTGRMQRDIGQTENVISRTAGRMGAALAGVATVAVARQLMSIADEANNLTAQLRLATSQSGSFAQAQEDVRRVADATRSDLSATAGLYANFQRNALELGITQEEASRATETVSKSFRISGAAAMEAAQATRQLVQGLQSGVLRGDEFNTVMEAAPRLARLLADSLGVPVGALRAMAEEGELTSDKLVRAFTDKEFTAGIDAEFKQMPVTFDQAMTQVYNSAVITFGEFDKGGGFSQMLTSFITEGSDGFGDLAASASEAGIDIRATFEGLANAFDPLLDAARSVFGQIESEAMSLGDRIRPGLGQIDAITGWLNQKTGNFGGLSSGGTDLLGRFNKGYNAASADRRLAIIRGGFEPERPASGAAPARPRATGGGGGGRARPRATGGGGARPRVERSPLDPKAFEREEYALANEQLQLSREAATTAAERARLETERLTAERARERAQIEADARYTPLQRERLQAMHDTTLAMRSAAVIADRDRELAQEASERAREAERENMDQHRRLQENRNLEANAIAAQADLARTREERLALERRLLDIAEDQERADLEALIATRGVADAEHARRALATAQAGRRTGVEQDHQGPLARYMDEMARDRENMGDRAEELVVDEVERIRGGMRDAIMSQLGVDDPLIASALDMLLQHLVIEPLTRAIAGASGTGGGGFIGAAGSFISGLFGGRASGGHVQSGKMYRVTDGEGFMPAQSGKIIPLGQMRTMAQAGGGNAGPTINMTITVSAPGANEQTVALIHQTLADAAPTIVQAAQSATMRSLQRKRMT